MEVEGGDGCRDSQQDFLGIRADFHNLNQTIKPGWGVESHTCVSCVCGFVCAGEGGVGGVLGRGGRRSRGSTFCNCTKQQTIWTKKG